MKLRLHGTEQKTVVQNVEQKKTGKGAALQQGSSSSTPQAAAGSLATDGKNRGKLPDVHQQPAGQDGKSAGRQQKKSFSLKSMFGFKKSEKTSAQTATSSAAPPEAGRTRRPTLEDLLAEPQAEDEPETAAPPAAARLTRSDGVKRNSLGDMNGRPMVKEGHSDSVPTHLKHQQLQNFSQMRQNMLSRINQPSSTTASQTPVNIPGSHHEIEEEPLSLPATAHIPGSHHEIEEEPLSPPTTAHIPGSHHEIEELPPTPPGSPETTHGAGETHGHGHHQQIEAHHPTAATPSGTSEITEEDDDSEFEQLNQQRLARERKNPTQPTRLGVPTPISRKFQPALSSIAESMLETESSIKPSSLQGPSKLSTTPIVPLGMTLTNGKLQLAASNPKAINTLLSQTLGKEDQHYLAHSASSDGRQHLLLDKQGRLFDIKSHESGYSVLHNSQSSAIRTKLAQVGDTPVSLENNYGKIQISIGTDGKNKLSVNQPGDVHRSLLSGVWQHPAGGAKPEGESIRLHDDKIHILNPEIGTWQTAGKEPHGQLSRQADGKLYAVQDSRTLHNLSDDHTSEKFVDKIKSFAVSEHGQVAVLTDTDSPHHICLMPSSCASPEQHVQFSLHLADTMQMLKRGEPHLEAQSIAISNGKLYAADSEGKLYSGVLSQVRDGELPMKSMSQKVLKQHFGHDHRIEGFFTDNHGQLNALVKDNFRQQHACPLGDDHQFHAGWNLSDTLVINSHLGLQNVNPEPHQILNMGREGSLTLQEGKVHYFDQLTKGWTAAESDCQQLKKGLDGAAYILKEGEVKRLDINQSTSSISQGKDNFFTLPHVRNKPELGSALQGLDKADKAQAMAVIGVNKYLALSEKGDIRSFQIKPGTQQLARPAQTLSREGITGTLKDIHVDHQQNLYAVNHDGEIFHQPREQWQSGEAGGSWQKLAMPHSESELERLEMDHENQPVATMTDGTLHQLREGEWHAHTAPEPAQLEVGQRGSEQVFARLNQGLKGRLIPGTGVNMQLTAQVGGQTGMENRKITSKFTDRVRAYIFNPTMATPRPIKNAAYNMQHSWQGRRGLGSVYEMQGALIKQLEAHNVRNSGTQMDLHSKMEALDLGEHGAALLNDMKRFREELEHSAVRSATELGQHQGVLKSNGQINEEFKPSASKAVIQSFNVNRSGRDLSKALEKAVSSAAPSPQSKLQTLLRYFVKAGVNMSHQKGDVPMGRQRDPNDETSLTKSRLILDTVTIGDLHQLADKAALVSGHQPDPDQIKQLRQQFDTLREKQYGANPVKQFTDMGFSHNAPLEANYDAVKAFINAFKKEHHGVNLTTRTVLDTQGNAQLEKKLKDTLLSLDGGESMSFSRAYGGGLSTAFVPTLNKIPVPIVPGAGITLDRAYNLSFGRTSGGLDVTFGRDGGATGTISVATGHDLMPYMTGKKNTAENASDWLSKKHKISPDFRIGGSISSNIQGTLQNSLNFKLTEDELPDFLHGLTHGTLTPTELMKKGIEHQMKQGTKLVFNVDTSAAFDLRAGINITNDGAKPDGVTARVSTGISGSANLVTAKRERSTQKGEFGSTVAASDNRATFLNSANVGANLTFSVGVAHGFTHDGKVTGNATKEPAKSVGTFPAFTSTNVAVSLAMDNRTTQRISVEMKQADPITSNDISELTSTLGKHFKDSESTKVLADLKKQENPEPSKQLSELHRHFTRNKVIGDDRYEAVRNLEQLVLRQQAAETNVMGLGSARHSTSYSNLSRLDENGIVDMLKQHFNAALPPTNATRLSAMMDNDPVLKGLIKQLQNTPFSSASVSMELKDGLRDQTEKAILDGKVGREELGLLFQDRNNLRIRSISVSQNVTKSEGFNTPTLLLGASNSAGVSMERNIGTINFKYGQDQDTPRRFTLEGEIAKANPEVASALSELRKEGFEMKS